MKKYEYISKLYKNKWIGFYGHYLFNYYIYYTGNSYFTTIIIKDLTWYDEYEGYKHIYEYKKHCNTKKEAHNWAKFIGYNPPNYIQEFWS